MAFPQRSAGRDTSLDRPRCLTRAWLFLNRGSFLQVFLTRVLQLGVYIRAPIFGNSHVFLFTLNLALPRHEPWFRDRAVTFGTTGGN